MTPTPLPAAVAIPHRAARVAATAAQALRLVLAAGLAANALAMLVQPDRWYTLMSNVALTGPLNLHFVRDIGCAYAVAALGLGWRVARPSAWPAALLGALFLLMHAGVHAYELAVGMCGWSTFVRDVPGVIVPALLAAGLALPPRPAPRAPASAASMASGAPPDAAAPAVPAASAAPAQGRNAPGPRTAAPWSDHCLRLLSPLVQRGLARFEACWRYDMGYGHALWAASPTAFVRFQRLTRVANGAARLDPALAHGARFAAVQLEDCGPCAQLNLDMAAADGVTAADRQAWIDQNPDAMSAAAARGWCLARAALSADDRAPGGHDAAHWRQQIVHHHGPAALAELALAMAVARSYPAIKRALGHAPSCQRLDAGA
jgi:hypothetical protein